jgi:hypothetical protein
MEFIHKHINTTLAALGATGALLYIIWANGITVGSYEVLSLGDELAKLHEVHTALAGQKSSASDPAVVRDFAEANNMVEASAVSYIFETGGVALERTTFNP